MSQYPTDYAQRLTDLYSDIDFNHGTDSQWILPPFQSLASPQSSSPSSSTKQRRPQSASQSKNSKQRRRRHPNKTSNKRFQNWYSTAMSEHVAKKKKALNGDPNDIRNAVKHAKKISEDEFSRWYTSALRQKDVSIKHLREKYDREQNGYGGNKKEKKFDADKFDTWYSKSVTSFIHKQNKEKKPEAITEQNLFDASHFEDWYEHQMELKH